MKSMKLLPLLAVVALFVALPSETEGYYTTEQEAVAYGESSALYKITYSFGFSNRDAYLPIAASRDEAEYEGALVYEIVEDGDTDQATTTGTAVGLVLSDAEVVDGMYFIPAGEQATFNLYVILTIPEGVAEADYALHVTALPFTTDQDGTVVKNGLTEGELSYYITPEVELVGGDTLTSNLILISTPVETAAEQVLPEPVRTEIDALIYPDVKSDGFSFSPGK